METLSCNIVCNNITFNNSILEVEDLKNFSDAELLLLFKQNSFIIKLLVYKQFVVRYKDPTKNQRQWDYLKTYLLYNELTLLEPFKDLLKD